MCMHIASTNALLQENIFPFAYIFFFQKISLFGENAARHNTYSSRTTVFVHPLFSLLQDSAFHYVVFPSRDYVCSTLRMSITYWLWNMWNSNTRGPQYAGNAHGKSAHLHIHHFSAWVEHVLEKRVNRIRGFNGALYTTTRRTIMGRTINVTRANRSSANIIVSKTTWSILFRPQKY